MKKFNTGLFLVLAVLTLASCGHSGGTSLDATSGSGTGGSSGSGTSTVDCTTGNCIIYLTSLRHSANMGGISGMDTICNSDSGKPANTGTYKAIAMATGTRTLTLDWALKANKTYTRADGTVIGTTNSSGYFTTLTAGLSGISSDLYWTGIRITTSWLPSSSTTCTGFTDDTTGLSEYGQGNQTDATAWTDRVNSNYADCTSDTLRVACAQQ